MFSCIAFFFLISFLGEDFLYLLRHSYWQESLTGSYSQSAWCDNKSQSTDGKKMRMTYSIRKCHFLVDFVILPWCRSDSIDIRLANLRALEFNI